MIAICWPWKIYGEYDDGYAVTVCGDDEENCMDKLFDKMPRHGELIYYSGVNDEDYVDGEYIGRDNFIYD